MSMTWIPELLSEVQAKGWPNYPENPDGCMERAAEFVGRFRERYYHGR